MLLGNLGFDNKEIDFLLFGICQASIGMGRSVFPLGGHEGCLQLSGSAAFHLSKRKYLL